RPEPPAPSPNALSHRIVAIIEVLLCSDVITQYAIGGTLVALGFQPKTGERLNVGYVAALSLGDAVLLIGIILLLLYAHGERPRDLFLGRRPIVAEGILGLLLTPIAIGIALVVVLTVQRFAPSLHTVENNPLQGLMRSPPDAWLFALVVIVAGG